MILVGPTDAVVFQRLHVFRNIPPCENAPVDGWVEGLHTPIQLAPQKRGVQGKVGFRDFRGPSDSRCPSREGFCCDNLKNASVKMGGVQGGRSSVQFGGVWVLE